MLGTSLLLLVLAAVLFAPFITPHEPAAVHLSLRLSAPEPSHPLGRDHLGRDLLARVLYGGRVSLLAAAGVLAGAGAIGVPLGLAAGYLGGRTDRAISSLIDLTLAFPAIVLVLFVAGVLGPSLPAAMLAVMAVRWAPYARLTRSLVLTERERDYVMAARAAGASPGRILWRHLTPNVLGPMLVWTSLDTGRIILLVAGLSFLGLGVQPPTPEWGAMLSSSRPYFQLAPELMLYPGLAIAVTALSCNLIGDGLRDRLDPHHHLLKLK